MFFPERLAMARRKTDSESGQRAKRRCHQRLVRRVGMYLCHACGNYIEREAEDGKPLKKWRKSYCEETGKNARIWLQLEHNMPHRHSPPNDQREGLATEADLCNATDQ